MFLSRVGTAPFPCNKLQVFYWFTSIFFFGDLVRGKNLQEENGRYDAGDFTLLFVMAGGTRIRVVM